MTLHFSVGFFHLWFFFVVGYGIIWASMIWANKKRGAPIEDPAIYEQKGNRYMIPIGHLSLILPLIVSLFIPVSAGPLFWTGLALAACGVFINVVAMHAFTLQTEGLNTGGIYRYSRNPMYVGGLLFLAGLNVMGWSPGILNIIFLVLSILWFGTVHWTVLREEAFLTEKYGAPYREFINRVPRYLGLLKQ